MTKTRRRSIVSIQQILQQFVINGPGFDGLSINERSGGANRVALTACNHWRSEFQTREGRRHEMNWCYMTRTLRAQKGTFYMETATPLNIRL